MRIKDKWHNELWWLIQENICEILITTASLVCIYFIIKAWIYSGAVNL